MCLQPTTCEQLKTVVPPITWEEKADAQVWLPESNERRDRVCTHMQALGDASTAFPTYFLSLLTVGVAAVKRGMFPPPFKEKSVIEISPPGRPRGATVARLTPEISPLKTTNESRATFMQEKWNWPFRRVPDKVHVLVSKEFLRGNLKRRKLLKWKTATLIYYKLQLSSYWVHLKYP